MSFRLLKSTSVVGGMTLVSRIMGLARDMVFSRLFGAGPIMDAFFVAFKIPNLLRRFFAEGAFSQAFVPVIGEYRANRDEQELKQLIAGVSGTLGLVLVVVTAIGVVAAPVMIMVFAPGFHGEGDRYDLAVQMLRFTFPYILFISLTGLAGSILNTFGRFAVPAFTPVLLNLVMIASAIWIVPLLPVPGLGLAVGVFLAGVAQLAFQVPFLARMGLLVRPRWQPKLEGVRRIGKLMLPAIFGSSVAQINILVDTVIASFLQAGSISWLYYSDRMMEFPLGVFGIALATVILPGLSRNHARAESQNFSATLDWALRLTLMIAVPAAVGLFVLAGPILVTVFFGGAFDARDVAMAELSLQAFALGLMGFSLVKVLAPGYFARQDTRTPVRFGVIALVTNASLNIILVIVLTRWDYPAPHAGLAFATGVAALLNAFLLFRGLRRADVLRLAPGWGRWLLMLTLGNVAMVLVLQYLLPSSEMWMQWHSLERVANLTILILAGAATYLLALWLSGVRPRHLHMHS
jgi:putative peptidoglycan lipid II flippase